MAVKQNRNAYWWLILKTYKTDKEIFQPDKFENFHRMYHSKMHVYSNKYISKEENQLSTALVKN